MDQREGVTEPSWRLRRRAVFGTLGFGALVIVVVLLRWDDTNLAETLVLGAFGLMGSALAIYSGTAAYQDVRLWPQRPSPYTAETPEIGDPYDA